VSTLGSFIWSIADQLRGPYRPNQYGTVILPFTILRRLDCILERDRATVRELAAKFENPNRLKVEVTKATGRPFYNTSNYSFANLLADADGLVDNLTDYVDRFSGTARGGRGSGDGFLPPWLPALAFHQESGPLLRVAIQSYTRTRSGGRPAPLTALSLSGVIKTNSSSQVMSRSVAMRVEGLVLM
jgi:hypothetical protein